MLLRDHMIERFERADVETDPDRKRRLLSFVVVGGGLVGVELFGEMTAFADEIVRYYPRVRRDELRFHLLQATERILPEVPASFARYAARVLAAKNETSHACRHHPIGCLLRNSIDTARKMSATRKLIKAKK